MATSRRFQHPHRPAIEPATTAPQGLDDPSSTGASSPDEEAEPPVERRAVSFSEARMAVQRLARGDPGGWHHLIRVIEDVNQPLGEERSTLLHLLVFHDQSHIVREVLEQGGDPTRADRYGVTPLALNESQHRRPNYAATRDALRASTVWHEQNVLREAMQDAEPSAGVSLEPEAPAATVVVTPSDPSPRRSRARL